MEISKNALKVRVNHWGGRLIQCTKKTSANRHTNLTVNGAKSSDIYEKAQCPEQAIRKLGPSGRKSDKDQNVNHSNKTVARKLPPEA